MAEVNGTFIYNGVPTNGATAKLWQASQFGSPPELDDAEPGAGQQGSTITTGTTYGGDGAYRWTSVPDGEYYISCYYDSHRVWQYVNVETIDDILTTNEDILVRKSGVLARLAVGTEGQVLSVVSGAVAWDDVSDFTPERYHYEDLAASATYTPSDPGLYAAVLETAYLNVDIYDGTNWNRICTSFTSYPAVVSEGTSLRYKNNDGSARNIVIMRCAVSNATLERESGGDLAATTAYTPTDPGLYSMAWGAAVNYPRAQYQYGTGTWWDCLLSGGERGESLMVGDGTNFRVYNSDSSTHPYTLMRLNI